MSRIWTLARKDLLETRRDRLSAIFIVIMPIAFTTFFGLMFGSGSDRLAVAVHDADRGAQSQELVRALQQSDAVRVVPKSAEELDPWIADGRAAAGLLIPEGFSAAVQAGEPAELVVVSDQTSSGAQAIAAEVRSAAGDLVAADRAARLGAQAAGQSEVPEAARAVATQAMAQPAVALTSVGAAAAAGQVPTGFTLSSPGMMVNFIMFSLMTAGIAVVMERKNGTLRRLVTTRVRRWELIAGKMGGMFALTFLQQILLIGVGQLFFGVDYLNDPAALLLMMIALSLVASCLGLLLASLLSSEQALVAAIVLTSMGVSALSGAWFPLEITGDAFRSVGHVLPTAWILDGLRGIIAQGYGVADVLPAFGLALAWSAGLFAVAVARFRLS
ncbi:MAG: ABC transporter permease [Thermoleophilia bacterium]|nr:ABC transporter permease [Thermoleophilia bacterium]